MENFIVSARKYRPATFDTVVGQKSITNTLKNAIKDNQIAQSYLFCGPRGVGKTTCARIFAKEINQFKNDKKIDDFSFNIFELDAASNNSVEDIRKLIDQVRMLDNDIIRLQEKIDTVLQIKENEILNRSVESTTDDDSSSR